MKNVIQYRSERPESSAYIVATALILFGLLFALFGGMCAIGIGMLRESNDPWFISRMFVAMGATSLVGLSAMTFGFVTMVRFRVDRNDKHRVRGE